jgi:16S rRNA processing protein RimM
VVAVHKSRGKARQRAAAAAAPATAPSGNSGAIEVGRIARAHGVRGELRVLLHWSESDSLLAADEVFVQLPGAESRVMKVESARRADRAILLKLSGVSDRDLATALRGATISVARADLPAAGAGEFYLCDLIGARVVDPAGEIGVVLEIRGHPSVDCLVIRTDDGRQVEQPLVTPWFERVDLEARCVYLSGRDGLIE